MISDWKKEIELAWAVLRDMEKVDIHRLWQYRPPRCPATEDSLSEAEAIVGHALDARYREFLRTANGWEFFFHDVTLFGTLELSGGELMTAADTMLNEIFPACYNECPLDKSEILPIAVSARDRDFFVITRPSAPCGSGIVIWLSGGEIERFATFDDFFLAMINYNRDEIEDFHAGQ